MFLPLFGKYVHCDQFSRNYHGAKWPLTLYIPPLHPQIYHSQPCKLNIKTLYKAKLKINATTYAASIYFTHRIRHQGKMLLT